jgi:hypothetical protein
MITAEGCRARRLRLWERLDLPGVKHLMLVDPVHVRYFANAYVTPISLGADDLVAVEMHRDGSAVLYHENKAPDSLSWAHVDRHVKIPWYDGIHTPQCPRQLVMKKLPFPPMDIPGSQHWEILTKTITDMRRRKDPDEIATIQECCTVAQAGHDWALYNVIPGMSEFDVYAGITDACDTTAGGPVVIYGDFAISPGPERRGGGPTSQVIKEGDLLILDFSVVMRGYRCDFTNTLCVGGEPTKEQQALFNQCLAAMMAGEAKLKSGTQCQAVYNAVFESFAKAGVAEYCPHHAGHGIGLAHPESPFFVKQSTETLREGDVVTLEPGLYRLGIGGLRIEHNYLITKDGYERLSHHYIGLTQQATPMTAF